MAKQTLCIGAVTYAPKVVTIWEGFKSWFSKHDLEFDYVLYSNYEKQVEDQFNDKLDLAWNSPLAWVRAERLACAKGLSVTAVAMRDTDCDLTSVLVVRNDKKNQNITDLCGKTIGFGAVDSPQATLIPMDHLRQQGLVANKDYTAHRFDILGGKHGDHVGGELDAAKALVQGKIDAAWMIDSNHLTFSSDGTLPSGQTHIMARIAPFDHCNFTVSPNAPVEMISRFTELLLGMHWDDPAVRPILELEGLRQWKTGRTSGYAALARAVDDEKFYDANGKITAKYYRY